MQGIDKRRTHLKLKEVAEDLGVSYAMIYRLVDKQLIPYRRYTKNGDYMIPIKEYEIWKEKHSFIPREVQEELNK